LSHLDRRTRSKKWPKPAGVLVWTLIPLCVGCYHTQPWVISPPRLTEPLTFEYRGDSITLSSPELIGDTILAGWTPNHGSTALVVSGRGEVTREPRDSVRVILPLRGEDKILRRTATVFVTLGIGLLTTFVWTAATF
jgi:hypothetical protein